MIEERAIWLGVAIILCGWLFIALFVALVRMIARREIERALKGYIAGHVIQPRNKRGQFRAR